MFKLFKKFIALLSVFALLIANGSVLVAAATPTFKDVPTTAWYYQYVEDLVTSGVIDKAENYRPNDPINRAELVKMVIVKTGGLASFTLPAAPTFTDTSNGVWYYEYVEAAFKNNIISGYKDSSGKLTGKFGPGDMLTRAQATKILVNAFNVPLTLTPSSTFSDVDKNAWYNDYVVTAYNQSVIDGYKDSSGKPTGVFGPDNSVTRAEIAKMIVNAQNPTLKTGSGSSSSSSGSGSSSSSSSGSSSSSSSSTSSGGSNTVQNGTLTVESKSNLIPSTILIAGTDNVLVSQYEFKADKEAFTVNALTVINDIDIPGFDDPIGTDTIEKVTITYPNSGGQTKSAFGTLTNGVCYFSNLDFYVQKNSTATLKVYADIYAITDSAFSISGKRFGLGMLDPSVSGVVSLGSPAFKATAVSSGQFVYLNKSGDVKNADNVSMQRVRKSKPVFSSVAQTNTDIITSVDDTLYKFNITANGGGVTFSRFVFKVKTTGLASGGNESISNWFFLDKYKNPVAGSHIWGQKTQGSGSPNAVYLKFGFGGDLANADTTSAGVDDGVYYVVVTLDSELAVDKDTTSMYILAAEVKNASKGDIIEVSLADEDEFNEVNNIDSMFDNNNDSFNTGSLVGNGIKATSSLKDSLFPGGILPGADPANQYFGDNTNAWVQYRSVIWSDKSGGDVPSTGGYAFYLTHSYAKIAGSASIGTVTPYSGTADWTNGYILGVNKLSKYRFEKK